MEFEVLPDPDAAAERGAGLLFSEIRDAIAARRQALIAVSGGRTPWAMLRALARREPDWSRIVVFQVDERDCPADDESRNLKHIRDCLPKAAQIEAMPVEAGEAGAEVYADSLRNHAGKPPILDVVHLGLGPDGHTASLVPGDPVLAVRDRDVAWTTSFYQGRRRMTLTYPALDRSRFVFWLVAGTDKRDALQRLLAQDPGIPAGRVSAARKLIITDAATAGETTA